MMYPTTFLISAKKGCPRRGMEAGLLYRYFRANGLEPVKQPKDADMHVIFACGGFAQNERRSLRTIELAIKKKKPGSHIVVTGCLDRIDLSRFDTTGLSIIPDSELDCFDSLLRATAKLSEISISQFSGISQFEVAPEIRKEIRKEIRDIEDESPFARFVRKFSSDPVLIEPGLMEDCISSNMAVQAANNPETGRKRLRAV